jgi:hypothetical protein
MRLQTTYRTALAALVVLSLLIVSPGLASTKRAAAAPTISGFTPKSGVPGTLVTITGAGLTGASVQFNGVQATEVLNQSDTSIRVRVPTETTTGPVIVITPEGTAQTSISFTITSTAPSNVPKAAHPKPLISSFSPTHGKAGVHVTLTGKHFAGATWVKFAGVKATFRVPSATKIIATVPKGAHSGKISVHTTAGLGITGRAFTAGV